MGETFSRTKENPVVFGNEKILEADKVKNEFLANISHELRTPLNSILGFADILVTQLYGKLNEKQIEYVEDIRVSGTHLLGMINEILDMSKDCMIEDNSRCIEEEDFGTVTSLFDNFDDSMDVILQNKRDEAKSFLKKSPSTRLNMTAMYSQ